MILKIASSEFGDSLPIQNSNQRVSHWCTLMYSLLFLTGKQFLKKSKTHKDKFERGNTDEFDLETGNVGEIEKIR